MMKKLLNLILTLFLLPALMVSCDKEDDKIPSNLYQEYEVLVENGSASAFANIREGSASGTRVNVGDRLSVNTQQMFFDKPVTNTDPEFTYFATLAANHTKAIFRFKNSNGKTLVNTADYGMLTTIVPVNDTLYEVTPGETVEVALRGASSGELKAYVIGTSALSTPTELSVMYSPDLNMSRMNVILPTDLTGVYDLVLDRVVVTPVTQGDGTAGGQLTTILRTRRPIKFI